MKKFNNELSIRFSMKKFSKRWKNNKHTIIYDRIYGKIYIKGKIMINKQELHDIFLKLRAGDTSQFELLYKNYKLLVYKIAFSILKNKETSEDVTQTVFTKIYSLKKKNCQVQKKLPGYMQLPKMKQFRIIEKKSRI